MKRIGLIGGSGLEKLNIFENPEEVEILTPYGKPSSTFFKGVFNSREKLLRGSGCNHGKCPGHGAAVGKGKCI